MLGLIGIKNIFWVGNVKIIFKKSNLPSPTCGLYQEGKSENDIKNIFEIIVIF